MKPMVKLIKLTFTNVKFRLRHLRKDYDNRPVPKVPVLVLAIHYYLCALWQIGYTVFVTVKYHLRVECVTLGRDSFQIKTETGLETYIDQYYWKHVYVDGYGYYCIGGDVYDYSDIVWMASRDE